MASVCEHANEAAHDGDEQRADKQISGNRENHAGFAYAAQVQDGDEEQNCQADRNGMGQQRRHRGDQCADAGGNADGYCEDVIGQQSRGVAAAKSPWPASKLATWATV